MEMESNGDRKRAFILAEECIVFALCEKLERWMNRFEL